MASQKLQKVILNVIIDYGGATWEKCLRMIQNALGEHNHIECFDKSWEIQQNICIRVGIFVK
jgi:hypothetical protein